MTMRSWLPALLCLPALLLADVASAQNAPIRARPAVGARRARPAAAAPEAAKPGATEDAEREPPGAAGPLPNSMDAIAKATDVPFKPQPAGRLVKFNLQEADLGELVNHISGMTGRRFIYGPKVRQIKATVISPEPVTLAEAYQAFLSILEANGMTVIPQGRFLKIVDSGGVVALPTPVYSRGAPIPEADRYVTRLYRLKYVGATEVMNVLNKFKSKEADITAYDPGQLLIITDTGTNVRRLIRIVEELDVGGVGQQMWIEPVNNGSADEMAKRIADLFGLNAPAAAPGTPGAAGTGSGLTRVVAEQQSNSLIVVGTEDAYLRLLELLKRIDIQPSEAGKVRVLPLQHANAEELSNTLTQMLTSATAKAPGADTMAGTGMFEGEVKVTADKPTNSLIITSSGRDYATLRLVITELDMPRRQVFIEAVIMDLSVSDSTRLGTSWHAGYNANLGGGSDTILASGLKAKDSIAFPVNQDLLQGFAVGARGPDLAGTSNLTDTGLSIPAFGLVLHALTNSGKSNVLATPHIIATDNTAAEINIGENIPLQENMGGGLSNLAALGQNAAGGGNSLAALGMLGGYGFSAPRQDVGNKIKVTPHINDSNQVRLEINQESSARGASSGSLGAVTIVKRTAQTTVTVDDQQTVVIGGLMRDEWVNQQEKIPLLGDIPLLGFLFRHQTTEKRKANLLLILTPYIIRDQNDLRKIFERKMQERQEFLDRYFVFSGVDWSPPRDFARANGLVEDIRQAYFKYEERMRLQRESQPEPRAEHEPGKAIELPSEVVQGPASRKSSAPAAKPATKTPAATKKKKAPTRRKPRSELDSPVRINPIARSVNVERVE